MTQEIDLGGTIYVSSRRAAEMTGYAQDYIGQLARSGQIEARRIAGLWYVLPDSIAKHKEGKDLIEAEAQKDSEEGEEHFVGSALNLDGREYVSAAQAAKTTGYSHDYVTQLARTGKVLSHQIGNRWYVDSQEIMEHKRHNDALLAAVQADSVGLPREGENIRDLEGISDVSDNKMHFTYEPDTSDLLPQVTRVDALTSPEVVQEPKDLHAGEVVTPEIESKIPIRVVGQKVLEERVVHQESGRIPSESHQKDQSVGKSNIPKIIMLCTVFLGVTVFIVAGIWYLNKARPAVTRGGIDTGTALLGSFGGLEQVLRLGAGVLSKELYYKRR